MCVCLSVCLSVCVCASRLLTSNESPPLKMGKVFGTHVAVREQSLFAIKKKTKHVRESATSVIKSPNVQCRRVVV